ncbi:MAG: restriction endonuclease subunit S [Muribaculaceae bacterium]|nr:restriction endonuclease subunit S [Muribaculaceae bacterium]
MNKNNWTYKKLGEVAMLKNGFAFKSSLFKETGTPIVRISNIQDDRITTDFVYFDKNDYRETLDKYEVYEGDILIAMSGATTGKVGINTNSEVLYLNQRVGKFVPQKELYSLFLFYYLKRNANFSLSVAQGMAQPNLSTQQINNFIIPIPPLDEQERIVAELDLLSIIIEKKKAQLKELDQLAQSIFYNMFGDPITNEKGWDVKKLGEVCEYSKTRIKSEELTADNYVGVENLLQDCKGKVAANKVPEGMGLTEYIKGDVLLGNIRPYLKKIWLANNRGGCNGDVLAIRIQSDHSNHIIPIYIFGCLSKDAFFDYDMQYSKGEKMPRGDKKEIVKYPICLPPLPLQQEFASKVEAIERQKSLIQQSIDEVQTLFDSRMDYYFN